ncbi:ATP-binding protein [Clostridium intestinale]|uniref:Putative transcriptional regulator with HTH domain n=1 Tax=Clostridium intestinale URNW TaxID=1294142 RepID=U2NMS1_9CLOT|nr:ATP-binding protein [Clostridium intestinale]ERK30146.1 putative transcriptional regulator with HTH domain [Clostridium intestinale URNW]
MKKYESLEAAVEASENNELEDTFLVDVNLSEETTHKILEIIKVHKDSDIGMSSVLNEAICSYYDNEINNRKNKKDKEVKKVKKIDPINIDNDGEEEYEVGGSWFDGEVESGGRLVREYFFGGLTENNKDSIEASKENKEIPSETSIEKYGNPFDDEVNLNANFEDMRLSLIKEYLYDTGSELYDETSKLSKEELLRKLDMIDDELRPKNIGLLMFSDSPEKFIPGCQLELVHFLGTTCDDFIEKTFHGPIYEQIRAVLSYIENTLIKSKNIDGEIFFNYPLKAIKEAIINAFYHRNYAQNTPIEVRIDKEKIVVVSYPGPDKFIAKEEIDKGEVTARIYRNRRIGEYLESLGLVNGNAVGLARMIKAMKDNNSPEPILETDDSRAYFTVKLYENTCYFDDEYQDLYVDEKQQKDVFISKVEDQILELLVDGPLSKKEISEYLGYENVPGNIKRALCKLVEKKLITYTIPENIRSKGQKYRLN